LLLDEYNTSKKCCNCWKDISNITIDGSKKFRLLGCKHCSNECNDKKEHIGSPEDEPKSMFQSHRYFTRDKNSCLNMLGIVKHMIYNKKRRPTEFVRGQ
jgi:predicted amidophosphoribosyltransferase